MIDVAGSATINGSAALNGGQVTVEAGQTLTLDNDTVTGTTFTDTASGAIISIDPTDTLTLSGVTINGGAINDNGGTIIIDPSTLTNVTLESVGGGSFQVSGTGNEFDGVTVGVGTTVTVNDGGSLILADTITIDNNGSIALSSTSHATTLEISGNVTLSGGGSVTLSSNGQSSIISNGAAATLTNDDTIAGPGTIGDSRLTLINNGIIKASGGTLEIVPDISGTGTLQIAGGATLQLDGSTPEQITFLTGTDILVLNDASGAVNTVDAVSTTNGTFTIQGSGIVNTTSGDGIDFTASGGTTLNPAVINIDTGGSITGHARGIAVTQNGTGNITIDPSATVIGNNGAGIFAQNNGVSGNITIDGSGNVTGTGGSSNGIIAQITNALNSGTITVEESGTITGAQGIDVTQAGTGDITIDASNTVLGNAGTGIIAQNNDVNGNILIDGSGNVTGTGVTSNGVVAQFTNNSNDGTITVRQFGNIAGGQDGIDATDARTVNGIFQAAGSGLVTVTTGTNAQITGSGRYGISASTGGNGSILVTTSGSGTVITSGATGILAVNQAPVTVSFTGAGSAISVTAYGTITSGSNTNGNGSAPAGIDAGYLNSNASGNVTVDNFANITAAAGFGIFAFMNGTGAGDVKVTDEANAQVSALNSATVTNGGPSNPVGIKATSNGTGNITVITSTLDDINAGSDGILAKNQSSSIASGANSQISVTAHGTIELGAILNNNGSQPAGILASYGGGSTDTPNTNVYGNISVDNFATITSTGGDGIRSADYGVGNINIIDEAPTAPATTLEIQAASGSSLRYGIDAENYESGNITITTAAGDDINTGSAGGSGIRALNLATTTSGTNSTITVTAYGTIESGSATDGKFSSSVAPAGILAGYLGAGTSGTAAAEANVRGDVSIVNHATIIATGGDGIEVLNYGTGYGTVGSITVYNHSDGNVTGSIGLYALTDVAGDTITITNDGKITGTGTSTEPVVEITQLSGSSATLTNTGTIEDSGTTPSPSSVAISETGTITITNTGTIIGDVNVDGLFNNNGGIWEVSGTNSFAGTSSINNAGTIEIESDATITTTGTLTISGAGSIDIVSGTLTLEANGGTLVIGNNVAIAGSSETITITSGGLAEFDSSSAESDLNVTFTGFGAGTLEFDNSQQLLSGTVSVSGFGAGDALDLANLQYVSAHTTVAVNGSTLTVTDGTSTELITLNGGSYNSSQFSVMEDSGSGTEVVFGDEWTNSGGGNWTDASWTYGTPISSTDAVIDLYGTYTIATSGTVTVNSLTIGDINATLSGTGTLSIAMIDNSGTIEANGGTLTIATGDAITNAGLLEATSGTLVLATGSTIDNTGLLEAIASGVLDLQDSAITNSGTGSLGIKVDGTSTFEVDVANLQLTGAGTLTLLTGSKVIGNGATDTLENFNNTTTGAGTIGHLGDGELTLTNDAGGTMDATGVLTIYTGHSITNAGLLEATGGGKLDVQDSAIINSGTSSLGIKVDGTSTFEVDVANLQLTGAGTLTLLTGSKVIGNGATDTLENFNNTITGAGTIGLGDGELTLTNDAGGTIDATGVLTIDTGHSITNAGLLEATGGGKLDVQDSAIINSGTGSLGMNVDGTSTFEVDVANLQLTGAGTLTLLTGSKVIGNGATDTLENFNNTIIGAGTIGHLGDGNLTLHNDAGGTIDATGVLTIDTGHSIANAGLLEATGGGKLDVQDSAIADSGTGIIIDAISTLLIDNAHLTLNGTGTLTLAGTVTGQAGTYELENFHNTIVGTGTISNINIDNDAAGTIEATGGTLVLVTGNTIVNAGLLEATTSGVLDVKDGAINNSGTGSLGIAVDGTSTFEVDVGNLQLQNAGTMKLLAGSQVIGNGAGGAGSTDTLENFHNTVVGAGTIGHLGDGKLTLHNDAGGTIDATGVLTIDTGHSITNAGLLEATGGGTLYVQDSTINNTGVGPTKGIVIANASFLVVDVAPGTGGTVQLTGTGTLTLQSGSEIKGNGADAEVLENVGNTIVGTGTIGTGDGKLTLNNDLGGTIDATGVLTIDTGHSITNSGLLEAVTGGTLHIEDAVTGSGAGYALIEGGTLEFDAASNVGVTFNNGAGTNYGELILTNWSSFTGQITGFTGTAATAASSDEIALLNFGTTSVADVATYHSGTGITTLTITSSTSSVTLSFVGDYSTGEFKLVSNGSSVDVFDPPVADQTVAPPYKTSGLGDHTVNSPINTSVFGTEHAILSPVTDATGGATSFLSGASTNSDQGLGLDSDQNGLLTKASALGNDHAIDPSAAGGTQTCVSTTDTPVFGGDQAISSPTNSTVLGGDHVIAPVVTTAAGSDHATAPASQNGTDHAAGLVNEAAFGGNQLATLDMNNGGDAVPVSNDLAPAPGAHAPGSGLLAGATSDAAFGGDQAGVSPASEADAGALASGMHGGSTQSLLSSLLNVLTGDDTFASFATSASGGDHGTAPAIGSGAANSEVTLSALQTAPTNEHVMAPALASSPTLASATFGTSGNDNFAFHPSLGNDTSHSAGAPANELAHGSVQVGGPALGSTAPEFHAEFALNLIHQDETHLTATVDQFHQMAANSTLLH